MKLQNIHTKPVVKKGILVFFLLISIFGFSQAELIKTEVNTDSIRIGEQFIYKLSIDKSKNIIFPKLSLKGLEVVDTLKVDTIKNKIIKKYVLTGFDSGAFYIPSQQVFIKNQLHLTDSLLINVATVATDTTKIKKFPIKGIKSEPYQFDDFKTYFYWALAIIILLIAVLYFFVFRNKKQETVQETIPLLPPYELAIKKIKELDEKLLWQNNFVKEYYSELTEILRVYIEDELHVPALENTSDEIVKKLGRLHRKKEIIAPNESLAKLQKLLVTADLVKFAKSKPLADTIKEDRTDAEYIIENLKKKPIIEEENAE